MKKNNISNTEFSAQLILNATGASNYNMLVVLVSPKHPPGVTYDKIITTFETHFCPKKYSCDTT